MSATQRIIPGLLALLFMAMIAFPPVEYPNPESTALVMDHGFEFVLHLPAHARIDWLMFASELGGLFALSFLLVLAFLPRHSALRRRHGRSAGAASERGTARR
jgi:hypothetical protein